LLTAILLHDQEVVSVGSLKERSDGLSPIGHVTAQRHLVPGRTARPTVRRRRNAGEGLRSAGGL